ncbi:redoxin domain-containing protein [Opitutia bacterium ISCC 51]|nr:redoxin domain-containing protein [Opitutae bacterium ISCC 51]QXD29722.1 redoxin domain-containing protein [Opitutae bacterium ISCC 52]
MNESDVLPDLSTFEMTGELPDLEGKVILLDFWASWCPPCKASFPAMDEIYADYKDRGLVILAVSVDSTEKAYRSFADKSGVSFPLVHDQAKKLVSTAEIEAMPTSFLIDKKGVIRSIHKGYQGKKTIANYREEIETLLAE